MHDFCFTPIYAGLLALGGIIGFIVKGSVESLSFGFGSALVLTMLTYISYQYFTIRKRCVPAVGASLLISAALTHIMGQKFLQHHKVHTGVIAVSSMAMSLYYLWNLLVFRPHFKASKTT